MGRIGYYVRFNKRCPGKDFLEYECQQNFSKRFKGQFQQIVNHQGATCINDYRFYPLRGDGTPLWEFKEHDHRLYCSREVIGKGVEIVLFNGWIKDKKGKAKEERAQIKRAKTLLGEYGTEPKGSQKEESP